MSDLTDYQRDAVEMICAEEDAPTALLRHTGDQGAVMLLNNGDADPKNPTPQLDLLAAYVAQVSDQSGMDAEDVYDAIDERLDEWGVNDPVERVDQQDRA